MWRPTRILDVLVVTVSRLVAYFDPGILVVCRTGKRSCRTRYIKPSEQSSAKRGRTKARDWVFPLTPSAVHLATDRTRRDAYDLNYPRVWLKATCRLARLEAGDWPTSPPPVFASLTSRSQLDSIPKLTISSMDMFGNHNVEHAVQGAAERGGECLTVTGNRGKEKLSDVRSSSQPHGIQQAHRGKQSEAEDSKATEPQNIGQVHVQGRTEDRNSSTSGLHKGMDTDQELLDSNLPVTKNPRASRNV